MKHKSTKYVNNIVIKNVYVLLIFLCFAYGQESLELKQADSLSAKNINNESVTILEGNIVFKKDSKMLYGDKAIQSNTSGIVKLSNNVKIEDENMTIFCDSLLYYSDNEDIELIGNVKVVDIEQSISSKKGKLINDRNKMILEDDCEITDGNRRITGDFFEIEFENKSIESLNVLENGVIYSSNTGFEKKDELKVPINNVDILKAEVINIKMDKNDISKIDLIGMASSFIHLYQDSLYQGTNEVSGDKIVLEVNNNSIINLNSSGGVIGKFLPSESNTSNQQKINYKGEIVEFDTKKNLSKMFGKANLFQEGMDLTASQININWDNNILEAFDENPFDSSENLQPILIENNREPITGKSMVYNIKNRKGKVLAGSTSVQNNMYMGSQITSVADSTFYIDDCIFTSCDPSKFYLGSKKVKIIYGDKVIAKPLNIVVGGVPIFGIPMAIFPHSSDERRSGWIMPSFGSSDNRGNYIDGLGYYFAPNDYLGSENSLIFADRQGVILKSKNSYKNRYKFNGNFNFEVRKHLSSNEQDIAKLGESNKTDFSLNWNHNQILRNEQSLRSNVSYYSNGEYNRETSINPVKRLNQQAISNATYSKRWKKNNLSLSINISNKQDLMSKSKVNQNSSFYQNPSNINSSITSNTSTLPSINFRVGRRNLFDNSQYAFLNNIQWDYSSRILNSSKNFYESELSENDNDVISYQWKQNNNGDPVTSNQTDAIFKNKFSINAPFTLFKYIAINPNVNINSDFVNKYQKAFLDESGEVEFDDINKFKNRTTGNISLSMNTKIYGILPIKIGKIQSVRHVLTPSISLSYSPNYLNNDNYFQEFNDEYYDYFSGSLIGSTSRSSSKKINIALGNVFQAKSLFDNEEEKINLFSLRMNTGYDFNKNDFKLSNLNTSIRSKLRNGSSIDINLTHDFYKYDKIENKRENEIDSLPRLTGIRFSTSFLLKGKEKLKEETKEQGFSESTKEFINQLSSNNWSTRIGISYTLNKINPLNKIENFWLNTNTSINVTNNWKLNYNARFNVLDKDIVRHNLTLYREIDCWEFFVDWTPNGYAKGLYFRLNLKSDILRDLKIEQKTGIYTTRSSF